jgi:hypothetical protein
MLMNGGFWLQKAANQTSLTTENGQKPKFGRSFSV